MTTIKSEQLNWAGNIAYAAKNWHKPNSIEELQALVQKAPKIKVVGTRHSFNHIADTPYDVIEMTDWNQVLNLDTKQKTVTVQAGMRYGELAVFLNDAGYALHNLASLPHISVVGAISTATHGSGVSNANLSSAVTALEFVAADGNLLTLSSEHDEERFATAVVGLGAIGAITKITLKIEPTYNIQQSVYLNLPFSTLENNFDTIMASAYSVSLFTDWQSDNINQIWVKSRTTDEIGEGSFFGAVPASRDYHPIDSVSAESCTEQLGIVGNWHNRLPHFKMNFTPSSGEELQSEYFVSRENAMQALRAINDIREQIAPHLMISEIRTIAADDLWMSPCYQRDCVALHFTWNPDWESVKTILPQIEEKLMPLDARPHWGKLFTLSHAYIRSKYTKWDDFVGLVQELDPEGKFRNPFLDKVIFGAEV